MITHNPKDTGIKAWVELIMFISSYYPLFLILYIRDVGSNNIGIPIGIWGWESNVSMWATSFLLLSSVCTLATGFIMRKLLKKPEGGRSVKVSKVEHVRGDMINYTLPFLIGLFAFDYKSWQSITSLIVFLIFMFLFTRKEKIILLNPMFLLLNIRLYKITYTQVGQKVEIDCQALCLGTIEASEHKVGLKKNSGINFLYPVASKVN
ncbi:hypothetical protein E5N05_15045 [Photobacterium sp. CAIM 1938]|uniref:hypothetical protein n=2 Tax=Photobacterium lucens TaxID=2562949 RepID=UPI0013686E7D|nr:hypothetical protein [Photobacterium lucens]MBP2701765.1 hypothetical protein [Vibrio parahaemolyticus]MZG81860.1 hypothetical protein [Photobacterium lucens]